MQICAQNARNLLHSEMPFPFVFKYFLASSHYFPFFVVSCLSLLPGPFRMRMGIGRHRLPAKTSCPQKDHNYRLSRNPKVVKWKMRKMLGKVKMSLSRRVDKPASAADPLSRPGVLLIAIATGAKKPQT
jgi:hypothetical protein